VGKIQAQLKAEVADLMAKAEAAAATEVPDGMSIPEELPRREERLRKIKEARARIEARARERHAREMEEHRAKMAAREAKIAATGKKLGGKPPAPPVEEPDPKDQFNLRDDESRIMPVAGYSFDQCLQRASGGGRYAGARDRRGFRSQTTSNRSNRCGEDRDVARAVGRGENGG
jgi:hypothetical protein